MKVVWFKDRADVLLLGSWLAIALLLRFTNLTLKPLWTDDFSTIVFSLGNSFRAVPTEQMISVDTLLSPLQPQASSTLAMVRQHLLSESNHPPFYFMLAHLWLKLFPPMDGLVSIWAARALPALLGAAAVPAMFGLGWFTFRSRVVAHLAAAWMAVSPFAVYLAQEARHYTLSVLWILASLACLVVAVRSLTQRTPLPWRVSLAWVVVNGLGVASHYFFLLTLVAEAMTLGMVVARLMRDRGAILPATWQRLGVAVMGTVAGVVIWIPMLRSIPNTDLTQWIYHSSQVELGILSPFAQMVGAWSTLLYLLPVEGVPELLAFGCGATIILLLCVTLYWVGRGLRGYAVHSDQHLMLVTFGRFVVSAIALMLFITYCLGMNLTNAFRYHFFYFPAVLLLVAAGLAQYWQRQSPAWSRGAIALLLIGGIIGSLAVVMNLAYQKPDRPDLVAQQMQTLTQSPALIAATQRTHVDTGRLMGVALELQQHPLPGDTKFLLAHYPPDSMQPITTLEAAIATYPRPFDLWLIGFRDHLSAPNQVMLAQNRCPLGSKVLRVGGYRYQLFRCAP